MRSARLERFAERVLGPTVPIELVALSLGEWDHGADDAPGADADLVREAAGLAALDALAAAVVAAGAPRGAALRQTLFAGAAPFTGDADDYYAPRNSMLAEALVRRRGLPITLTVLTMAVGARVGLVVDAIALPGHVVARLAAADGAAAMTIDPFHQGRVLIDGAAPLPAMPARALVARMLRNLAGSYGRSGDLWRSLEVLERMAICEPDDARLAAELTRLRARVHDLN